MPASKSTLSYRRGASFYIYKVIWPVTVYSLLVIGGGGLDPFILFPFVGWLVGYVIWYYFIHEARIMKLTPEGITVYKAMDREYFVEWKDVYELEELVYEWHHKSFTTRTALAIHVKDPNHPAGGCPKRTYRLRSILNSLKIRDVGSYLYADLKRLEKPRLEVLREINEFCQRHNIDLMTAPESRAKGVVGTFRLPYLKEATDTIYEKLVRPTKMKRSDVEKIVLDYGDFVEPWGRRAWVPPKIEERYDPKDSSNVRRAKVLKFIAKRRRFTQDQIAEVVSVYERYVETLNDDPPKSLQ